MDAPKNADQFIEAQNQKWEKQRERGVLIKMKDVGREGWHFWKRTKWTFQIQHDFPVKVLVMERIEADHTEGTIAYQGARDHGAIEYRIGYYTLGGYRSGKGRWLWGQYSPMIPQRDFGELLRNARAEGTLTE